MVTAGRFASLQSQHQAAAQFQARVAGEEGLFHRLQHTLVHQAIAGNGQVTLMAMPRPRAAILSCPTGRATIQVDQVKLGQWRVESAVLEEYIARMYEQTRTFIESNPAEADQSMSES